MNMYRQGDVLVVRVESLTEDTKAPREVPRDNGRIVLAYGEVTGHSHSIDSPEARLSETQTGERFLEVLSQAGVKLTHEEHSTILLPPGTYKVVQQREYLSRGLSRLVAD